MPHLTSPSRWALFSFYNIIYLFILLGCSLTKRETLEPLVTLSRPAECRAILSSGSLEAAREQRKKKKKENNVWTGQKAGKVGAFCRTAPQVISR
jgi:hypothetical protein